MIEPKIKIGEEKRNLQSEELLYNGSHFIGQPSTACERRSGVCRVQEQCHFALCGALEGHRSGTPLWRMFMVANRIDQRIDLSHHSLTHSQSGKRN